MKKKEVSDLKGEFKGVQKSMQKLIKAKASEDNATTKIKDQIVEAKCDLKHL